MDLLKIMQDQLTDTLASINWTVKRRDPRTGEVRDEDVRNAFGGKKVDDPSQSARAFYVSSPEPKD